MKRFDVVLLPSCKGLKREFCDDGEVVFANDALAEIERLNAQVATLKSAIKQTLDENGHLADGNNCTLIRLKRAMKGTK